jgi:hypothetical protein
MRVMLDLWGKSTMLLIIITIPDATPVLSSTWHFGRIESEPVFQKSQKT